MCQDSIDWPFNYKAMLQFAIADAANLDFSHLDSHPCATDPYFVRQGDGAGACGRQRPLCLQVWYSESACKHKHNMRVGFAGKGRRARTCVAETHVLAQAYARHTLGASIHVYICIYIYIHIYTCIYIYICI